MFPNQETLEKEGWTRVRCSTGTRSMQDFPQIKYVNRTETVHCGLLQGAPETELNCLNQLEFTLPAAAAPLFGLGSFQCTFCLSWVGADASPQAPPPSAKYVCTVVRPFAKFLEKYRSPEQLQMDGSRREWTRHLAKQRSFAGGLVMLSGAIRKSDQLTKDQYFDGAGWGSSQLPFSSLLSKHYCC